MQFHRKARWIGVLLIPIMVFSLILAVTPPVAHSQGGSTERIESDDAGVGQSGSWTAQPVAGGSYLYSTGSDADVLTLEFEGTSVEVIYVSGPSLGTLAIEVDGTVLRTVITTAGEVAYAQSSKVGYLTNEPHTLKVYAQAGGIIGVDAFVVRTEVEAPEAPVETVAPPAAAPDAGGADQLINNVPGEPSAAPTALIINEVDPGDLDSIELFNPTSTVINLTSYSLLTYAFNNALEVNYNFPAFALYPGAYVTLYEGPGTNTSTRLYMVQNIGNWVHGAAGGGAVTLSNAGGTGIDFVRWGTATVPPPIGQTFTGTSVSPEYPETLGRSANSDENDSSSDWFAQCGTLGGPNQRCLVINEVFYGDPDQIEIYNGTGTAINLDPYVLQAYDAPNTLNVTFNFPVVTIQPDSFMLLIEGAGTNTATTLYMGGFIAFINTGGAVALSNGATPIDFMQWGNSTTPVPVGTDFAGTASPAPGLSQGSFARNNIYGYDYDRSNEWCGQVATLLTHNNPCVVINEVDTGDPDSVEIYNASTTNFVLTSWNVQFFNQAGGVAVISFTLPAFTLNAGAYVRILEGSGTNTATTLYTTTSITDWSTGTGGSVILTTPFGTYHDFVRWGGSTHQPGSQILFSGPPLPGAPAQNFSVARNRSGADTNATDDWCVAPTTLIAANYGCNGQLALFLPSSNFVSLINTNTTPPGAPSPNDYFSYAANVPGSPTGGQWVVGDWNGDGERTPGVYYTTGPSAGVFYITNQNGPNSVWVATWFGLFAGVAGNIPVAGRFAGGANDCLGVIDSQNFPPHGVAFALYFTCTTSGGNPAKTVQWNSILLPNSGGFSGTFQFSAGDFDGNGIDSIACRRGEYITWSNTNPTVVNGEFPNAQYIGTPPGSAGVSYFVVGDWDNSGLDSFGLFYSALGRHYFRNDLVFNSGVYGYQDLGLPLGATATAATWTGY